MAALDRFAVRHVYGFRGLGGASPRRGRNPAGCFIAYTVYLVNTPSPKRRLPSPPEDILGKKMEGRTWSITER
jgi:hypothetical protein